MSKTDPTKSEPAKAGPTGSSAVPGAATPSSSSTAKTPEAAKSVEAGKPSGSAPSSTAPSASGSTPLKPGATGSSAVPPISATGSKSDASKSEPAKPGATGSSAIKPDATAPGAKADGKTDAKSDAKTDAKTDAKPETKPGAASSATRVTETGSLTDGPILDLKAKRVPDPETAAKPGTKPGSAQDAAPGKGDLKSERAAPSASAASRPAGPGFGAVAASGLLGGLIGAGLLYGVTTYQRGADPRLAALDKTVAGLATKDALASLDKRLAADEQTLKSLPDAVGRAEAAAKAANDRAGEALKKAEAAPVAGAAGPAVPADLTARLDALDQRVSALQEEPGGDGTAETKTAPAADPAALAALDERIKTLEASGAKAPSSEVSDKLAALQGDVETRTKANEAADAALAKRLDEVQKALDGRIAATTQAVQEAAQAGKQATESAQARVDEATRGLDRKLQEQADKISALDKIVDQSAKQATVQAALRMIATNRIDFALAEGQPYPEALASLRNLESPDSKRLDALAPFAEKGAPTAAALAAEFRTISAKVAEAKRAAQAKAVADAGSVTDRLMNMASSIVQVKRVDEPAPGGARPTAGETSTAQVQAALDRGDLSEAAKAYASLPEQARSLGGDFGARLTARAEAQRAAQGLQADAFTGLPPAR